MLSEEESEDRFDDADENEDGKVTWEEYIADAYGINNGSDEEDTSAENAEVCKSCIYICFYFK